MRLPDDSRILEPSDIHCVSFFDSLPFEVTTLGMPLQ